MRITERQLREIIRKELIQEGFFDNLGTRAMTSLSKFIRPDAITDDMTVNAAKNDLHRAVFQFAVSWANHSGEDNIEAGIDKAREFVQSQQFEFKGA